MATKKEISELLKKLNLKESDIDAMWKELYDINWKVKNITDSGNSWKDLHISVIEDIPTLKEKTLASLKEKEEKEKKEAEEKQKQKEAEEYYANNFEKIMYDKILAKENLDEDELSELVDEYSVVTEKGDTLRWTQLMTTIVKLMDKHFAIPWQKGLTEYQENVYLDQPYEVEEECYPKTIIVHEWRRVEN